MTIIVHNKYDPDPAVAAAIAAAQAQKAKDAVRALKLAAQFVLDDPNQFRLVVNGVLLNEVKSATLLLSVDAAADGFTAVLPYLPELKRDELLSPPGYPKCEVYLGGKKRFTGRLYTRTIKGSKDGRYRTLEGASPIADAIDSTVTPPYEANQMTLAQYANTRLQPFGISATWEAGEDKPFTRIKAQRDEKVTDQIFKLAKQRAVFVMSDVDGNVVFHTVSDTDPVATFEDGKPPMLDFEFKYDGRKWFGQSVAFSTAPRGNAQATAVDDRFPISRRTVVEAPEGSDADVATAAEWGARRAFSDGLELPLSLPSWYVSQLPGADIWLPNQIVRVVSPLAFLPNGFDFLIRSVEYRWDGNDGARCTLDLVPPVAYQTAAEQKKKSPSWKARKMLSSATGTPLEDALADQASE